MPQEFLDRANVIVRLQEIGRERVAQGVAVDFLGDVGVCGCNLDGALQDAFMKMVGRGNSRREEIQTTF
jgi:hypothetical protein